MHRNGNYTSCPKVYSIWKRELNKNLINQSQVSSSFLLIANIIAYMEHVEVSITLSNNYIIQRFHKFRKPKVEDSITCNLPFEEVGKGSKLSLTLKLSQFNEEITNLSNCQHLTRVLVPIMWSVHKNAICFLILRKLQWKSTVIPNDSLLY